jgi:benzoyl-CoA reductase subunit B
MLVQKAERKWETRPLDCWAKAKELRAKFYQDEATAKEQGSFLVEGSDATITAGIGNCHVVFCNPLGASIANESTEFARQCRGVTEGLGYGRDIGGYIQNALGAMFSNRGLMGREFHPRDFVMGNAGCDMHRKHTQIVAEYFGIPFFFSDGIGYYGEPDKERDEARMEFLINQQLELIEWLEKTTGKEFNEEDYVETARSSMRIEALMGDTLACLQHIPSPLDQKSLFSLIVLGTLVRSQQEETEKFWVALRDEMRWRVENNIAALATERFRWVEEEPPPWHFLRYYRYMEEYGAICLGTMYQFVEWQEQPDGTWTRPKTLLEQGVPLNTKEDVIRATVSMMGRRSGSQGGAGHGPIHEQYIERLLRYYYAYRCDGVILPLQRTGIGCVFNMRELALKLEEMGVPLMHYETSHPGNRTDLDENRMLDQLDIFMETRGLRKLED